MWPVQNFYKSAKGHTENEIKTLSLVDRSLHVMTSSTKE